MMTARRPSPTRAGWTVLELALVLGVVGIAAGVMMTNIDFARWRLDSAARTAQNAIISAQAAAVQNNRPVIVTFMYNQGQYRVVIDKNANGVWDSGSEVRNWRTLPEKSRFMIPPSTIDGAFAYYATGPGLTYLNATGQTATCMACPTFTLYPNGSASGDVVVYIGTKSTRKSDYRALQVYGSTSKVYLWRMMTNATWKRSDL